MIRPLTTTPDKAIRLADERGLMAAIKYHDVIHNTAWCATKDLQWHGHTTPTTTNEVPAWLTPS
jgi:hypothetical protein